MVGYSEDKESLIKRLARIEGQVRGVSRMVEEDRYCIEILDQVSAIKKALEKTAMFLLRDHLDHCVVNAIKSDKKQGQDKLDEALLAIERLVK
ncbi:MAG: metal-sensitive transcriptional regulator [Acidimicrobiia bacterium]|nr:metal-sensitive transcriptional regulator [Acidimicrobiia bacterium]